MSTYIARSLGVAFPWSRTPRATEAIAEKTPIAAHDDPVSDVKGHVASSTYICSGHEGSIHLDNNHRIRPPRVQLQQHRDNTHTHARALIEKKGKVSVLKIVTGQDNGGIRSLPQ
ncbi:hypothetical protein C0Q70_07570 [Pomacea canaliculata]|uniref:Uncharacterized protein n=1 Tax=Pomacea canaliculata TaxID=400727 RepID=A0A2T7PFF0_POMCA|nr:hypothetical protein C0Q70_07570 [Pomacea canaliculata]